LLRLLDAAIADANRITDHELVDRLARAKAAAEHSRELVARLSGMIRSEQTAGGDA
jgi:hypothetical protein